MHSTVFVPRRNAWHVLIITLVWSCAATARAQYDEPEEDIAFEVGAYQPGLPGSAPMMPGGSSPSNSKDDKKSRRLQMIGQLSFDRRPSAILKAWHEPPPAPPVIEPKPADKSSDGAPAKVDSAVPVEKPAAAAPPAAEPSNDAPQAGDTSKTAPVASSPADVAAAAKKAAEEQKKQAAKLAEEAKRKSAEDAAFKFELTRLQRQVTLGEWKSVREFIATLDADEAKALYGHMLTSLQAGSMGRMNADPNVLQQLILQGADIQKIQQTLSSMGQGPGAPYLEKNLFTMPDVLGLMLATPVEFEEDWLMKLGATLRFTINAGFDLDAFLAEPPIVAAKAGPKVARVDPLAPEVQPVADKAAAKPGEKGADAKPVAPPVEKLPRAQYKLTARDLARLLCHSQQETRAGDFLPTLAEAASAQDGPGLNLIVRHVLSKYAEEQKSIGLEQAWKATQAVLEIALPPEPPPEPATAAAVNDDGSSESPMSEGVASAEAIARVAAAEASAAQAKLIRDRVRTRFTLAKATRDEALTSAVQLAPQIRKELGQNWLEDSFRNRIERGKELLTAIGSATSRNLSARPQDSDFRKKGLELQETAVAALLRGSRDQVDTWREPLTVMAVAWLKEAETSWNLDTSASDRGWRRDRYGNFFMYDEDGMSMQQMRFGGMQASPIKIDDMLELQPAEAWLALVSSDLRPKFAEMFARLHLKMQDEAAAFPHIERLAKTHPKRAKDLAEEFVRVWTTTHNPNEKREGYDPFMYYWGGEQRADRIPLTRSKQQRNLVELASWIKRIKALSVGEINETLLTGAFTIAHSKAEVYRLEAIESVFGSIDALKPRTLAELIQQMRGNLASVWRMPDVQRQNSTNRKQKDIRGEVLRGYEVSRAVVRRGLQRHPGHWALILAEAAVLHDENEYQKEFEKSSDFTPRRRQAFELFAKAAEAYIAAVPEIPVDEQTVQPFEMWFYAGLGSVDLARITADKGPDPKQPALIRAALTKLPGEAAERHLSQFANNLFTRASDAKPELKQRYLKAGFDVVGKHKLAREARKLYEYYSDLVTEIKLETKVDGPDSVGHGQPFGVFVNLVHTKEIERESGGFGKYLQNQNHSQMYFYNFGRPLENYRDKFSDFARKALGDHFEVLSVTFQEASVNSRALPEYGWRSTPYAYLLLKSKGPEVDKLAPLRMDFDFLDTSGYAVLPVESPVLPLDSKSSGPPARPVTDIVVTQTLDERQSDKGKLLLEIRTTARGLVPDFEQLLELNSPGFAVDKIDDRGLAVIEFDKESPENAIRSERQWMVSLVANAPGEKRPTAFRFGTAKVPVKELIYQRYEDADLKGVTAEVALESGYGQRSWRPLLLWSMVLAVSIVALVCVWRAFRVRRTVPKTKFEIPATVTPFTAIGFLRELEAQAGFDEGTRRQLAESIAAIERHYFQSPEPEPPDLGIITQRWLKTALDRGA